LKAARLRSASSFCSCFPHPSQFCRYLLPLAVGNGIHDIALFVDQTTLTGRRSEQGGDRRQQSIVPISDNQINFRRSPSPQILDEATPAIFVFLCACP
jgi:hypothetical protein